MQIPGSSGNDTLTDDLAPATDDVFEGFAGDDLLITRAGQDTVDGGEGFDTVSFARRALLRLDLDLGLGRDARSGTVLIGIEAVTGTLFRDTIIGDAADNLLEGSSGDDRLGGAAGNDTLRGGTGEDTLEGGEGFDVAKFASEDSGVVASLATGIATGRGTDRLSGIEGLLGTILADDLTGDDSDNLLGSGEGGADTLDGGLGFDTASFAQRKAAVIVDLAAGEETTTGTMLLGIEAVEGSFFDDTIGGDAGANVLRGRTGDDAMAGAAGSDTVIGGRGDDSMEGGAGFDLASFADARRGVTASLVTGEVRGIGRDTIVGFEGLIGSAFADSLTGDDAANLLDGGVAGTDTLVGGAGYDTASFIDRDAAVAIDLAAGTEASSGTLLDGIEAAAGSRFADVLTGDDSGNVLDGWAGADSLVGAAGSDTLIGGAGDDTIEGGDGFDLAAFADAGAGVGVDLAAGTATGHGTDRLDGIEGVIGSAFADTLAGDAGDNWLNGGSGGADVLAGGDGFDTASFSDRAAAIDLDFGSLTERVSGATLAGIEAAVGSAFGDTIAGDGGNQFITAWLGDDSVDGGGGNDSIAGNAGDDTLAGGDGLDIVTFNDAAAGVVVDLAAGTATGEGSDRLDGFEGVFGTAFDDSIAGDAGANFLNGWTAGSDTLLGGAGYDTISFADRLGSVTVDLGTGTETVSGSSFADVEAVVGSRFGDSILGDAGPNVLQGFLGNDSIGGGAGSDTIEGGAGDDALDGGAGFDVASFVNAATSVVADLVLGTATGDGTDRIDRFEGLIGSAFDDSLGGDGRDNLLNGGIAGRETLTGGAGFDTASFADRIAAVQVDLDLGEETGAGSVLDGMEAAIGSRFADSLAGDAADNLLLGLDGGDTLAGRDGSDTLGGGAGDDAIDGGDGFDVASFADATTGVAADLVQGRASGQGDDTLTAIEGLVGSAFADTLTGNDADNILDAGTGGQDSLVGGGGFDTAVFAARAAGIDLDLGAGTEAASGTVLTGIEAAAGSDHGDTLRGGAGANTLSGLGGDDRLDGGAEADTLLGGLGDDTLTGGDGFDMASYADAGTGVAIDLGAGTATGWGTDSLLGVEGAIGSDFADTITGATVRDAILAGAGDDSVAAGAGNDTVDGGEGDDTVLGGIGFDLVDGGAGDDSLSGDNGNDTLTGGEGHDALAGGDLDDVLRGGAGDDALDGGAGRDTADFAAAAAAVLADLGAGTATGQGTDSLLAIENLAGGGFDDSLTGDDGDNRLAGAAGNDQLIGGDGADDLIGGLGADLLTGGLGADTFRIAAGEGQGDVILDFSGAAAEGDMLTLAGYGTAAAGATLTDLGGGAWRIRSFDGAIVEEITIAGQFAAGDAVFV